MGILGLHVKSTIIIGNGAFGGILEQYVGKRNGFTGLIQHYTPNLGLGNSTLNNK